MFLNLIASFPAREVNLRAHFGQFGAWPVRLAYGLLGLGLTVLCVTGINLWLMKRAYRNSLDDLWLAWVWAWPLSFALAALAALNGLGPWLGLVVALPLAFLVSVRSDDDQQRAICWA